jgi:hypothetical protein
MDPLDFHFDTHGAAGVLWEVGYYLKAASGWRPNYTDGDREAMPIFRKRYHLERPFTREKLRAFISEVRDHDDAYPSATVYQEFDPSYVEAALWTFDNLWPAALRPASKSLLLARMVGWLTDDPPTYGYGTEEDLRESVAAFLKKKFPRY